MIPVIVAIALIALIIYSLTDKGQMRDGGNNNSNGSSGSSGSSTPPPSNTNASSKSDK